MTSDNIMCSKSKVTSHHHILGHPINLQLSAIVSDIVSDIDSDINSDIDSDNASDTDSDIDSWGRLRKKQFVMRHRL